MFILNKKQLGKFDLSKAKQFVDYWGKPYSYGSVKDLNTGKVIDYIKELNLGSRLSEQNLKRLLRWKDRRRLTEEILFGPNKGKDNIKVLKVLKEQKSINRFRQGDIRVEEFKITTEKIFPKGFVWQIFLFHIARPFEFPIADRNVFRTFLIHKNTMIPKDGIYILFEKEEFAHSTNRIVRIGTHTGNNKLRSRLKEHFVNENKDRSIFRKNIGRALLNKDKHPFLKQWEIDLTTKKAKELHSNSIDLTKQKEIEKRVTKYVRDNFSFVVFQIDNKDKRLELESKIISTVSLCDECKPSPNWLGLSSPN